MYSFITEDCRNENMAASFDVQKNVTSDSEDSSQVYLQCKSWVYHGSDVRVDAQSDRVTFQQVVLIVLKHPFQSECNISNLIIKADNKLSSIINSIYPRKNPHACKNKYYRNVINT